VRRPRHLWRPVPPPPAGCLTAGILTADDVRLAHHADGVGDAVAVLLHAPHREAVAQYERALAADGRGPSPAD
jgi:hypothetical protein